MQILNSNVHHIDGPMRSQCQTDKKAGQTHQWLHAISTNESYFFWRWPCLSLMHQTPSHCFTLCKRNIPLEQVYFLVGRDFMLQPIATRWSWCTDCTGTLWVQRLCNLPSLWRWLVRKAQRRWKLSLQIDPCSGVTTWETERKYWGSLAWLAVSAISLYVLYTGT